MTEPQTFRSAFNGFHREDVVNHIAYMTNKHESQVKELRSENDTLRTELEELRRQLDRTAQGQDRSAELEKDLAAKTGELASLRAELTAGREELDVANQLLAEQGEQIAALKQELANAAKAPKQEKAASYWDELRAYRRAETMERQAKERVSDLFHCADIALRGAEATLDETDSAFTGLTERIRVDLVELMDLVENGKKALHAAADTLDSLRAQENE